MILGNINKAQKLKTSQISDRMEPVVAVEQQAQLTVADLPQSGTFNPIQQGNTSLLEYIASVYGTRDLANVDPLHGMGKNAAERARTRTLNVPMTFEGSPSTFDDLISRGIPIRMSLLQALDGKMNKLIPNAQMLKDTEQGPLVLFCFQKPLFLTPLAK